MMKLIVDTNIVISALIKDSITRKILLEPSFEFYVPEIALIEIMDKAELITDKSGLSDDVSAIALEIIFEKIEAIPKKNFLDKISEAEKLMGHIDKGDIPFLALALSIENDGIWSNDEHFSKQTKVKHWKTEDVLKFLISKYSIA